MSYHREVTKGLVKLVLAAGITYATLNNADTLTEFFYKVLPYDNYAPIAAKATYITSLASAALILGSGFRHIADDYEDKE